MENWPPPEEKIPLYVLQCGGLGQTSRSDRHPAGRTAVSEQSCHGFLGNLQHAVL